MVESIRPGRAGGIRPFGLDATKPAEGRFSVDDSTEPAPQMARLSTVPSIGLEGMLALQTISEPMERDRAARKRGLAMITALTDLQRAMLAEEDPSLALRSLSDLAADGPLADDPALGEILRSLVLRSRVEVVRRTRDDVMRRTRDEGMRRTREDVVHRTRDEVMRRMPDDAPPPARDDGRRYPMSGA